MSGRITDHQVQSVRTAAILTGSYVAGTIIDTKFEYSQLMLYIAFTKGSLTSAEIKIEFSNDNTTFYQETYESISGGTNTIVSGNYTMTTGAPTYYRLAVPIKDRFIKVSAQGTGTATSSSMAIEAILGHT